MMIKIQNTQTIDVQKSALSVSPAAAGTALIVKNISGFTNGWYAQVGETGGEKTEIKAINGTPSSSIVPVATLTFTHPIDTPVYAIKYDQVVFKVSTAGTSGTAAAIAGGTVSITPDWDYTQFDHTSGSASYAYKTCYLDSVNSVTSSDSGWLMSGGYNQYSLAHMRNRVKGKLSNSNIQDGDIDSWLNEWLENMNNAVISVNEDYALGTATVTFTGSQQEGTITDADFKYVRKVEYAEGSNTAIATKMEWSNVEPSDIFNSTSPFYYMKDENIIGRQPHANDATMSISYYKLLDRLQDDTDELPIPLRGYTNSFVRWSQGQALRRQEKYTEATQLEISALNDLETFKQEISPRSKSGPQYIDIVESLAGDDQLL